MHTDTIATWPYLRLSLPAGADPDWSVLLTQSAADTGALGALLEGYSLIIFVPRDFTQAQVEGVIAAIQNEAASIGWGELPLDRDSLADQPWATAWKVDFKPLPIGRTLVIRPDWEHGQPADPEWSGRHTIWVRPGFGFGTGRHETTRLALDLLEHNLDPGMRILDYGSGSGILSIAAIRLGASSVTAIELDPDANLNARENFELNAVTHRIYLVEGATPTEEMGQFNLIVANMLPHEALPRLTAMVERMDTESDPVIIYSGFLLEQQAEIEAAFGAAGLVIHGFAQEGEWGALVGGLGHHLAAER